MNWLRAAFNYIRLRSGRIGTQIAVLVVLAALFTYAGNTLLLKSFEQSPNSVRNMADSSVFFSALPILSETEPEKRQAIADLVNLMAPSLDLTIEPDITIPDNAARFARNDPDAISEPPEPPGGHQQPSTLAEFYTLNNITIGTHQYKETLAVLSDNTGIHALLTQPPSPPSINSPQFLLGNWLVLLLVVLPIALVWAVVSVSQPLRRFADAAEDFSIDGHYAPLPETGPDEIKIAARALNSMRQRIAVMAADRTRMLSSVGHDLRTPVTRMRLRAEFIEDEDIRTGQLRDLARMESMIDNTLSFIRDGQVQGKRAPTDLVSLLQALVDDYTDLDSEVTLFAPEHCVCTIEPDAFRRMIENLVQNGLKFGTSVQVHLLTRDDSQIEIKVEDNGPGIPEAERKDMLKPFVTGDTARSGTGFGLGLSIAQAIARAHEGELDLDSSEMGGLLARITLPRP